MPECPEGGNERRDGAFEQMLQRSDSGVVGRLVLDALVGVAWPHGVLQATKAWHRHRGHRGGVDTQVIVMKLVDIHGFRRGSIISDVTQSKG